MVENSKPISWLVVQVTARVLPLDQVDIIQSEVQLRHLTEITLLLVSRIAFHNPKSFRDEGRYQKWSAAILSTLEDILVQVFKTQSKNKNRIIICTLPPSASHTFPCLGPNQPISALSSNSSANADCAYAVLSRFIVSSTRYLYFSELMRSSPNPILDVIWAGCKPVPRRGRYRPRLCSG